MTTVSPKKNHDPARVNEISEKLMENPELASLISELSTSADDASELVKGLLQASINAGLQAEMDAHLGYSHSDRKAKAQVETTHGSNHRNGKDHSGCFERQKISSTAYFLPSPRPLPLPREALQVFCRRQLPGMAVLLLLRLFHPRQP